METIERNSNVAALDAFDEVQDAQVLIEAIEEKIATSECDSDLMKVSYLLSIYKEKMADAMAKLKKTLDCIS